jgi:RNA polymerase sigma-70 factor (ECF subfamily)
MTAVALTRTGAVSSGTLENDAPMAKSAAPADVERLSRMMRDGFDPIWRLLRRLGVSADAADDAAQEVFMVAARRIHEIEAGSEQSYLYGTALRVAKSHHRRQASSSARHVPLDESRLSASTSPEQALDQRQRLALLDDALGDLDQDERSVFVLFEIEGMTLTEIAELLDIPRGTTASRLRRARARFVRAVAARKRGSRG